MSREQSASRHTSGRGFNKIDDTSFRIDEEGLPAVLSATGPPGKGGGKSETPQGDQSGSASDADEQRGFLEETQCDIEGTGGWTSGT